MKREITNRAGKNVYLGLKPLILQSLWEEFDERNFFKSDFFKLCWNYLSISRIRAGKALETLTRTGWLNSRKFERNKSYYHLSKKSINYRRKFGFLNEEAPLMKKKESKIEYIEKEVPFMKKIIDKDKFIGEV